jgi:hypothetical protein
MYLSERALAVLQLPTLQHKQCTRRLVLIRAARELTRSALLTSCSVTALSIERTRIACRATTTSLHKTRATRHSSKRVVETRHLAATLARARFTLIQAGPRATGTGHAMGIRTLLRTADAVLAAGLTHGLATI